MLSALNLVFKGGVYLPTCLLSGFDGHGDTERRGKNKGKSTVKLNLTPLLKALNISARTQAANKPSTIRPKMAQTT